MRLEIEIAGKVRLVEVNAGPHPGVYSVVLDGVALEADARLVSPGVLSLLIGGRAYRVVLEDDPEEPAILVGGRRYPYRLNDPRSLKARRAHVGGADGPKALKASMPGRVVRVLAQHGDAVEAQQSVVVIEAMKMQNELKSPRAGIVAELRVSPGDTVAAGDVLAVIS